MKSNRNSGRLAWVIWALTFGLALASGCGTAQQATPQQEEKLANFQLAACQVVGVGLYKCPSSDKVICNPDYVPGTHPVDCVHVDRNGTVIVQSAGMPMP